MKRPVSRADAYARWEERTEAEQEAAEAIPAALLLSACAFCGSTKPMLVGNEVHEGYDGFSVCPDCKGV